MQVSLTTLFSIHDTINVLLMSFNTQTFVSGEIVLATTNLSTFSTLSRTDSLIFFTFLK